MKVNNIHVRGFTVDDPNLKSYAKFFEIGKGSIIPRFLPEEVYSSDCSIEVFENSVRLVIMRSKQALIIESSEVAIALKQIFEMLWKKTEDEYILPKKLILE